MDELPKEVLMEILTYLPSKSFLPTANVSNIFREAWLAKSCVLGEAKSDNKNLASPTEHPPCCAKTNPLQVGNLFQTHWNRPSKLLTSLLEYYVSTCGWNNPVHFKRVMKAAISRGDIQGVQYLYNRGWCQLDDEDYCTVAGAAGQLDTLKWLREVHQCPWDPVEVLAESYHNHQCGVIAYVEENSCNDIRSIMSFR